MVAVELFGAKWPCKPTLFEPAQVPPHLVAVIVAGNPPHSSACGRCCEIMDLSGGQRVELASRAYQPAVKHHDDTFMRMASGLLAQVRLGERRQLYAMLGPLAEGGDRK